MCHFTSLSIKQNQQWEFCWKNKEILTRKKERVKKKHSLWPRERAIMWKNGTAKKKQWKELKRVYIVWKEQGMKFRSVYIFFKSIWDFFSSNNAWNSCAIKLWRQGWLAFLLRIETINKANTIFIYNSFCTTFSTRFLEP